MTAAHDRPETTVGLDDAEALATWCVFWSEMPGGPRQGAMAAKVLRMQAKEIARLRAALLECAGDLDDELKARYGTPPHPADERRFARDMETVTMARKLANG